MVKFFSAYFVHLLQNDEKPCYRKTHRNDGFTDADNTPCIVTYNTV